MPLLAFFALALGYAVGRMRGRADSTPPQRALSAGARDVPRPLEMLCGFMSAGHVPPPVVVHHAIAEAEILNRPELARQIADRFVDPRVPIRPEWLPPAAARAPAYVSERERERDLAWRDERAHERRRRVVDVEVQPVIEYVDAPPTPDQQPAPSAPTSPQPDDPGQQGDDGAAAELVPPPAASQDSPLPEVSSGAWRTYAAALETAPPSHDSERRVGRYAQRKDRLRSLGLDPQMLIAHPRAIELQDAALAIDAVDSARHLAASGTLSDHVGRRVVLPGESEPRTITFSGILGISQVAGLEKAVSWIDHQEDKKRFPHTTATFARTNGVF